MYHYVRYRDPTYPNFNSLNFDIFRRQLDFFEHEYGFISRDDYIEAIRSCKNIDGAVLSFDDGFSDHYYYVFKELESRNLWGIFYIPTAAIRNISRLLGVHRVHFLNGKYGSSAILKESIEMVEDYMLQTDTIDEFDKEIYQYSDYGVDAKKLRRLFNYYLKYDYRDEILDKLMLKHFDEPKLGEKTYLTKSQIREMSHSGNIIGSHTENHKVLSRLSYEEQLYEIKSSFDYLSSICQLDYKSFCYPYGYLSSYNEDTLKILREEGFDDAVIFDNKEQGKIVDKYQLSRVDCNNFMDV